MKDYVKTSLLLAVTLVCVVSCTKKNNTINGHEYVDLGLSVMWATCNIGAESPSDYGDYFAWGETEPISKEKNSVTYEKNMGSIAGDPQYDAATANWGGSWRMPTNNEIKELINQCEWEWITFGEKNGYKVTGPNGNSIFLPAAGDRYGTSLEDAGEDGYYWSATPSEDYASFACNLSFNQDGINRFRYSRRDNWLTVRPVISSTTSKPTIVTISEPTDYIDGYGYVDLGLTAKWATCNVGAKSPTDCGDYFVWGETEPKSEYTEENSITIGKTMDGIAGNSTYDAATANWGCTWRMPTNNEIKELINQCEWEWTTYEGTKGYKVTGPNGNSIFLPAAGGGYVTSPFHAGEVGSYLSATPREDFTDCAFGLNFNSDAFFVLDISTSSSWVSRYSGHSVRPVSE